MALYIRRDKDLYSLLVHTFVLLRDTTVIINTDSYLAECMYRLWCHRRCDDSSYDR